MQIVSADRRPSGRVGWWGRHPPVRHGSRRSVPPRDGWIRERPGSLDNFPHAAPGRGRVGPKGHRLSRCPARLDCLAPLGSARSLARRARRGLDPRGPRTLGSVLLRTLLAGRGRRRAEPLGPARRLLLGAAARGGGVRRDHRGDDPAPRLGAGPRLRRRLLLRPDVVDARGRRLRLGGPQRAGGAVLRPAGGRRAAPAAPPRLAALGGGGVDRDGGAAQRMAVQRHAVGSAGLRGGRHARGAGARVRRGDRGQPAARPGRAPGSLPSSWATSAGWWPEPRPGRDRCRPAGSRRTALGALARRHRRGSPRCRATCRATAPTCWPTSAR